MIHRDFRFQLESPNVTGRRQQKTTCPHCGRRKCFVRYVDTQNQCRYLDNSVGRCDHEQSCGYHYRPKEYFQDNPRMREEDSGRKFALTHSKPTPPPPPPPLVPLPSHLLSQYHSPESIFWQWTKNFVAPMLDISEDTLRQVYDDYQIGAYNQDRVIFWQIDQQGQVRSGQIMSYKTNGDRRKNGTWMHSELLEQNNLPQGFYLCQCLFGEHLLPSRPDAQVCLVESQKTAVIMAAVHPDLLWLATCGSNGITPEKLECLRGRRVTIFPDSGCYDKWQEKMKHISGIAYTIDDSMEQYPPNSDLVDLILGRV